MNVRVNDDEFAILKWLHDKHEQAAPDVEDFLSSALRDQLKLEEIRYKRARDYLHHFNFIGLRQAELTAKKTVEAIRLTPDGENFYRHAVADAGRYRFGAPPAAAAESEGIPSRVTGHDEPQPSASA